MVLFNSFSKLRERQAEVLKVNEKTYQLRKRYLTKKEQED